MDRLNDSFFEEIESENELSNKVGVSFFKG
jgi:hypothetical protein